MRRMLMAGLLAVNAVALSTPVAAAAAGEDPTGYLDSGSVVGDRFELVGWAYDRPDRDAAAPVDVYDYGPVGPEVTRFVADRPRPDVNAVLGVAGDHGFVVSIPVPTDNDHRVCVASVGVAVGTAAVVLGCVDVTAASHGPIGYLDRVSPLMTGQNVVGNGVLATGWAVDPDAPGVPTGIRVVDVASSGRVNEYRVSTTADRPDVVATIPAAGSHVGLTAPLTLTREPGVHQVCLWAVNVGIGSDTPLGCATATVPPGLARGSVDAVTRRDDSVAVRGWSLTPADPTTAGTVTVELRRADGSIGAVTTTVADGFRPDVGAAVPGAGDRHGFTAALTGVEPGDIVCVTVAPSAAGGPSGLSSLIGCRRVDAG